MFENLTQRLDEVFKGLRRRGKLSESDVDAAMREVRLALLEADVNYGVVRDFVARVRERSIGQHTRTSRPAQLERRTPAYHHVDRPARFW
jgi:signal recognition particle subunit SRP54